MNNIIEQLPKMIDGEDLINIITSLPKYDNSIINKSKTERLIELENIYNIYIPSKMTIEIYNKLYLSILKSLKKKQTKIATLQQVENYKRIIGENSNGIIGGADSFTIIGTPGIGKSSAIIKSIQVSTENKIIENKNPYKLIIPCLIVQCPFDCSAKGLLFEILRKVDELLDSDYYNNIRGKSTTTDTLIGCVSQVMLNHVGLLIVDEIQNVVKNKNGQNLISLLTQLINNSGISICMVGTPESALFFEQEDYLARRAVGLRYSYLEYNEYFKNFCKVVFNYQYVKYKTEITIEEIEWLYENSAGILANVITLIHDAQEIAIINDYEKLDLISLKEAYKSRLGMMHNSISSQKTITKKRNVKKKTTDYIIQKSAFIYDIVQNAKKNNEDIVNVLKNYIQIEEIKI